jgi:hypothetical protein
VIVSARTPNIQYTAAYVAFSFRIYVDVYTFRLGFSSICAIYIKCLCVCPCLVEGRAPKRPLKRTTHESENNNKNNILFFFLFFFNYYFMFLVYVSWLVLFSGRLTSLSACAILDTDGQTRTDTLPATLSRGYMRWQSIHTGCY